MSDKYDNEGFTFETFRGVANLFSPCMNDFLYIYDIVNDTYSISPGALDRFAIPSATFTNVLESLKKFIYAEDIDILTKDLEEILAGKKSDHNLQYRWIGKNGNPIWINCRGRLLYDNNNQPTVMIGCINEIGKRQYADNVSGLMWELSIKEHFDQFTKLENGFLLRIGIDDLKVINERLGLSYGDFVLREVASAIQSCLHPKQYVCRVVSDEFLIIDFGDSDYDAAHRLYHNIRVSVDKIIEKNNYEAVYTVSGGLLLKKDISACDYDTMMRLSEFSLNTAKLNGKNQLYIFNPADYEVFLKKRALRIQLKQAVSNGCEGFELYFQPIISLNSEKLFAAETLLRYTAPDGTKIYPNEFIPILEDSGLIIPVGKWIIHNAIKMCKECQKNVPGFKISINLSYIQLLKSPIHTDIMEALTKYDLKPESLIVELTESGFLENNISVQNVWQKLKNTGVNIAIDDFGTGYSNLQNISNLNPNIVKIDRSFTVKSLQNEYEHKLMAHIIDMIHSIGLTLIVEGIEEKSELTKISEMSPDFIQGYYYSMPCPKDEFEKKFIA